MNWKTYYKDPFWQIAGIFLVIKFSLHVLTCNTYELHRDEMLYFNQGDYPALGNATVPPLIGWVAYLVKGLFGYSVFGVRFVPMVLGSLSVLLIAKLVKDFEGGIIALVWACAAFVLSPGFLLFDSLFTVNVIEQFFWLLIAFLFTRMVNNHSPRTWLWIGTVSGLAFLNKYLVVYLLTGFLIALLLGSDRKLLWNKFFSYALVIGLIIISPNIYWQYQHAWPIFVHVNELRSTQMVNMTYKNFLTDLFDLNYVGTFLWIAGLAALLFSRYWNNYRYIGICAFIVIALFMLSNGKAYYALGIIPVLFVAGGCTLELYMPVTVNRIASLLLFLFLSLSVPYSIPLLSFGNLQKYAEKTGRFVSYPFSRWEDGKLHSVSQVFSDMTGWKEMVDLVSQAYYKIPEDKRRNTTIYAERNYGYAGAVHFYGKPYNLPEPITFLDSYVIWAPDTIPKGPMIYINYDIAGVDKYFERYAEIGVIKDVYFREKGLKVFLCEDPRDEIVEVYRQKAKMEKRKYQQSDRP